MVFVLDRHKKPLMPCSEKRAKKLLSSGQATVHKFFPVFTIRLKGRTQKESILQDMAIKIDPGSKQTGIAMVMQPDKVKLLGVIEHKQGIKQSLEKRRAQRRGRRQRKTRYRKPRFLNRTRPKGWLPPSLIARVGQTISIVKKLIQLSPIASFAQELVKFDMQKMQNPEISGVEYQQGTLLGYEVREYLLEKWARRCAYCGKKDVPLEVEHIISKKKGGSDRVCNLTLACERCNKAKDTKDIQDFLNKKPRLLKKILAQAKTPLKDAAVVNTTRWKLYQNLHSLHLPIKVGTGAQTKMNRITLGIEKQHWYDALCVREIPQNGFGKAPDYILHFFAIGRGNRQIATGVTAQGFPFAHRLDKAGSRYKKVHGLQTGDFVSFHHVGRGKWAGKTGIGRVNIKQNGSFKVCNSEGLVMEGSHKYFRKLQHGDGWRHEQTLNESPIPTWPRENRCFLREEELQNMDCPFPPEPEWEKYLLGDHGQMAFLFEE